MPPMSSNQLQPLLAQSRAMLVHGKHGSNARPCLSTHGQTEEPFGRVGLIIGHTAYGVGSKGKPRGNQPRGSMMGSK